MSLYRWRATLLFTILLTLLLAACAGSSTSRAPATPTPAPRQGQELLTKVGKNLNAAKTLHGIFDVAVVGPGINGIVNTEVWNEAPGKSRTVVLQSTITQIAAGTLTHNDRKKGRENEPAKQGVDTWRASNNNGSPTPRPGGRQGTKRNINTSG